MKGRACSEPYPTSACYLRLKVALRRSPASKGHRVATSRCDRAVASTSRPRDENRGTHKRGRETPPLTAASYRQHPRLRPQIPRTPEAAYGRLTIVNTSPQQASRSLTKPCSSYRMAVTQT